jgi:hypothetical protein
MDRLSLDLLRPKANSVRDPSFGARTHTKAEAMTNAWVLPILHFGPLSAHRRNPPFHDGGSCDAIGVTNGNERRRFR